MVSYAPYFISTVVLVGMLNQFFDMQTGFVNYVITGLGGSRVNFMGIPSLFRSMYVWSGIWQSAGYGAIIYLAALSGIDVSLIEAATIDGANRFQRVINIELPGISPTIVILLLLSIGGLLGIGFEKIYLMQNPFNLEQSEIISTYVYKIGLQNYDVAFATAIGLFNSVVSMFLLICANMLSKKVSETSLW